MARTMLVRASNFEAVHLELFFWRERVDRQSEWWKKESPFGIPSLKILSIPIYLGAF